MIDAAGIAGPVGTMIGTQGITGAAVGVVAVIATSGQDITMMIAVRENARGIGAVVQGVAAQVVV